jgi:hypothetical protein
MNRIEDPFVELATETVALSDAFASLEQRGISAVRRPPMGESTSLPTVGRLRGFDLLDRPLIENIAPRAGHVLTARTVLPLRRSMIGRDVVVVFDGGDLDAPIIMGVIEPQALSEAPPDMSTGVAIQIDGDRHVVEAEREIILRCGDASITLTRAGKVIIKGNYILSRSTGCNKIKGAVIDIN